MLQNSIMIMLQNHKYSKHMYIYGKAKVEIKYSKILS